MELEEYLRTKRINKERLSLKALKKRFPKDKATIDRFIFLGLLEPSLTNPDTLTSKLY